MSRYFFDARTYLITLITLLCIVLNVAGYFYYRQQQVLQASEEWVAHTYEVIGAVQGFYGYAEKLIAAQRGYLITGQQEYLNHYAEAEDSLFRLFSLVRALVSDNPEQIARVEQMNAALSELRQLLNLKVEARRAGDMEQALNLSDQEQIRLLMNQVRDRSADMLGEERRLLDRRSAERKAAEARYHRTLLFGSVGTVGLLLGANVLVFLMARRQRDVESNLASTREDLGITRERLELALKGTSDGLFDWQVGTDHVYYSPRFREMLGYSEEEFPDSLESFKRILHPDDAAGMWETTERYFNRETDEYRSVFRLQHRNGSWRWHLARGIGVFDASGRPVRLIGAHTDMTESKTLENNLRDSNKELEEFTYIASHDLRSPLVNLKGFAGEMGHAVESIRPFVVQALETVPTDKASEIRAAVETDIPEALGFIRSSVERMDRLTSAILELSRIGRREMHFQEVDTRAIVERCLGTLQHQIHQKGVEVDVGDLPAVVADPVTLEQIFGNIIDNAVKYLDPSRPGRIEIGGHRGSSETRFYVSDNGRGIAPSDAKKIFEIFRRAGNNNQIPGEGMGMAYVRTMLRRHGGDIRFESEPGKGTTFYFTIAHYIKKEPPHG